MKEYNHGLLHLYHCFSSFILFCNCHRVMKNINVSSSSSLWTLFAVFCDVGKFSVVVTSLHVIYNCTVRYVSRKKFIIGRFGSFSGISFKRLTSKNWNKNFGLNSWLIVTTNIYDDSLLYSNSVLKTNNLAFWLYWRGFYSIKFIMAIIVGDIVILLYYKTQYKSV